MKSKATLLALCMATTAFGQSFKFDLGGERIQKGYIGVNANDRYTKEKGYGFDLSENSPKVVDRGGNALKGDFITSDKPFYFSVDVPDGNYRVKITFGDTKGSSVATVRAESRRLMIEKIETKNNTKTVEFVVNKRNTVISGDRRVRIKEREKTKLNWDDKLTLEFSNENPCVAAIEIEPDNNVPTVFLCGNSTVVDQDNEPWCGWGQMLPRFLNSEIAVANYAESGESGNSFISANRLEKILNVMKPGDYIFVEFGHNDQKQKGENAGPYKSYTKSLKTYIEEARKRGGIPVLVTSMHRRRFDENGKIINTLGEFPQAVRDLAKAENVAMIDLNNMSEKLYEAMGVEGSIKAFVHYKAGTFPGQTTDLADNTHFNDYGGYQLAKCIVQGIRDIKLPLAKYINKDFKGFDPSKPDPENEFNLPKGVFDEVKPDGN